MKYKNKYWSSLSEKQQQKIKDNVKTIITALAVIIATIFGLSSCGTTRATITKPAEGTSTTITITTNNPITTNTNPNVNFK